MTAPAAIQIAFTRSVDLSEPAARLVVDGLRAQVDAGRATVAVAVPPGEDSETLEAVARALDGWLADRGLPFSVEQTGPATFVIRPPAG
jgi:hypothetical protein